MKSIILVILLLFSSVSYAADSVCYRPLSGPYDFEIVCINGYQYIATKSSLTQSFEKTYMFGHGYVTTPIQCKCENEKKE